MSSSRSRQTGFTVTELMVVLVIIGILAAVATPSLTRDSTARKGRDFANQVAQGLQRSHFDAVNLPARQPASSTAPIVLRQSALISSDRVVFNQEEQNGTTTIMRTLFAPAGVVIVDAAAGGTAASLPQKIYFNTTGNACSDFACTSPTTWVVHIQNQNLPPRHPDFGFVISVTGLTSFVSTRSSH